jgi:hypothetical protein
MPLSTLLSQARATSIEEVVSLMTAIERALSISDGLWWFNDRLDRFTSCAARGLNASIVPLRT